MCGVGRRTGGAFEVTSGVGDMRLGTVNFSAPAPRRLWPSATSVCAMPQHSALRQLERPATRSPPRGTSPLPAVAMRLEMTPCSACMTPDDSSCVHAHGEGSEQLDAKAHNNMQQVHHRLYKCRALCDM